jgi:sec-independent protein translocase protein TatA
VLDFRSVKETRRSRDAKVTFLRQALHDGIGNTIVMWVCEHCRPITRRQLMFSGFGVTELLVVLAIVLLIFGPKRLKNLGSDLGSAIKGFRSAVTEETPAAAQAPEEVVDATSAQRAREANV